MVMSLRSEYLHNNTIKLTVDYKGSASRRVLVIIVQMMNEEKQKDL